MYYILTLVIIIFYLIFYRKEIKNNFQKITLKKFKFKKPTNNKSNLNLPYIQESFTNPIKEPELVEINSQPIFSNRELGIDLFFDIIQPNPKYFVESSDSLLPEICQSDKGKCGCLEADNGETICGFEYQDKIYECATPCPECHKCHLRTQDIDLKYDDFCHLSIYEDEKKKCQQYQEIIINFKENCLHSQNPDVRIKRDELICNLFNPSKINSYLVGEDIFFIIKNEFTSSKSKNNLKKINLLSLTLENKNTVTTLIINNFYESQNEIYFFLPITESMIGENQILELKGNIELKSKQGNNIDFLGKQILNIFPIIENNINTDISREKFVEQQINLYQSNKNTVESYIKSVDDDRFANHYLGKSKLNSKLKVNNQMVENPIKNLELGSYLQKKLIDNPTSWKQRADINRPWDYIIE